MTLESALAFMNKVADTDVLRAPMIDAWISSMDDVIAMGKTQGYDFTPEDVIAARDMPKPDASPALKAFGEQLHAAWNGRRGELTDDQLELVAGGTGGEIFGPISTPPKIGG